MRQNRHSKNTDHKTLRTITHSTQYKSTYHVCSVSDGDLAFHQQALTSFEASSRQLPAPAHLAPGRDLDPENTTSPPTHTELP